MLLHVAAGPANTIYKLCAGCILTSCHLPSYTTYLNVYNAQVLLQVQNTTRLCMVRDLTEHDVVSRIMRKENYLIGMLNKGVLALHVGTPCLGLRKRFMLTKTLEWNLYWCLLDCMFGEDFRIKPAFLGDAKALQKRFRYAQT